MSLYFQIVVVGILAKLVGHWPGQYYNCRHWCCCVRMNGFRGGFTCRDTAVRTSNAASAGLLTCCLNSLSSDGMTSGAGRTQQCKGERGEGGSVSGWVWPAFAAQVYMWRWLFLCEALVPVPAPVLGNPGHQEHQFRQPAHRVRGCKRWDNCCGERGESPNWAN